MKCGKLNKLLKRFSFFGLYSGRLPALLIAALLTAGRIPLWPQSSEPKSSNSEGTSPIFNLSLEALNRLHNQASSQLTGLTQDLNQASQELQTSKNQLTRLQNLLDNALQKSTDLEATNQRIMEFNSQIGERMQARDEELAIAYTELDGKEKQILKMWIAVIALGLGCLGFITFSIVKLLAKLRVL